MSVTCACVGCEQDTRPYIVWPARPSQQAPRGEEGKGRSSIAIGSHLALSDRKAEKVNRQVASRWLKGVATLVGCRYNSNYTDASADCVGSRCHQTSTTCIVRGR